jgi:peptidoglycan/LPS O-acetylase OafA/YrhL
VIYAVSLGARAVLVGIDTSGAIRRRVDALMSALVHGPFLPIALAAPTAMVLVFLSPGWRRWFGVPPPDQSFVPTVPALVAYGSAFVLGWFLHRQTDLLNVWERRWPIHLAVAIAMTAISLSLVGVVPELEAAVRGPGLLVYAACYMVGGWAWTFAIVGTALRFFNQRSSVRRYLADASYWIYLMHLPVLFFLQAAVMDLHWHWSTKFLFVLMTTLAVSLASYHVLVRDTVLGVILNGRRHGRRGIQHAAVEVRPSIV